LQELAAKEYSDEKTDAVRKRNLQFISPHIGVV
jgi:hypothetical protein